MAKDTTTQSYAEAFSAVRAAAKKDTPFGPQALGAVDEAALIVARKCRALLPRTVAMNWDEWTRFTAQMQGEIARAIRHAAFDSPEYPGSVTRSRGDINPWEYPNPSVYGEMQIKAFEGYAVRKRVADALVARGWAPPKQHPHSIDLMLWGEFAKAPFLYAAVKPASAPDQSLGLEYHVSIDFSPGPVGGRASRTGTEQEMTEAIDSFRWLFNPLNVSAARHQFVYKHDLGRWVCRNCQRVSPVGVSATTISAIENELCPCPAPNE